MKSYHFLKKLLLAAAASLLTVSMFAQNVTVSGTVTDEGGFPVIGASVMIPGTTTGAVTDIDGKYTLEVDANAILEISSIGYNKVTEQVGGRTVINVILSEDKELLDDVVVVGYAVGNKKTISGAIERVTAEDMNTGYVASAIDAIRGKIPGLVISTTGGSLDAPTVRLRGTTSLSGGSDPLVIIDGSFSSLEELDEIASQDIEEISVLKDASESAQYGSRGAAGVIVVTTKKGEQGKASISYNGQFGVSTAYKQLEMLSADEWRDLNERKFNGSGDDLGANTNWYTWVQNPLVTQNNHNISLTQGTTKGSVRASIGFNQRNGLIRGTGNNTYNMRLNASQKALNNKLNLEMNLAGTYREGKSKPGVWSSALVYNPTYPSERNAETGLWDIVQAAKSMTRTRDLHHHRRAQPQRLRFLRLPHVQQLQLLPQRRDQLPGSTRRSHDTQLRHPRTARQRAALIRQGFRQALNQRPRAGGGPELLQLQQQLHRPGLRHQLLQVVQHAGGKHHQLG